MKKNSKKLKKNKINGKVVLLGFILVILAIVGISCGILIGVISTTTLITADELKFRNLTTTFYDSNGSEIAKVYGSENRSIVALDDVGDYLKNAIVDIEDERFFEHNGVDIKRTLSATANYGLRIFGLSKGNYGGSTITQQLVKNVTGDNDTSPVRKVREIWRSVNLERSLTKDEILEAYLNTIYLGENCYGILSASRTYFDKEVGELSLAESALIAGITQNPSLYDPFINLESSLKKKNTVLKKMYELGHISKEEYETAVDEEVVLKRGAENSEYELLDVTAQTYFIDAVCDDILEDLVQKNGVSESIAKKMLYNDGLKIYTTLDTVVQDALDSVYEDTSVVFSTYPGSTEKLQSAMTVIDYTTGHVVGMSGGVGKKTIARAFNRATSAVRQPGSSIKPIGVYGPALEEGLITSDSIVVDEPITIGKWSPVNSSGTYSGAITIRQAITSSNNVVAVKVLKKLGIDKSYSYLEKFGISTLESSDRAYAALALGGLTQGVTTYEMAAAFGTIANEGYYIAPVTYTKVVDSNGKIILQNNISARKVLSEKNSYVLTDMLTGVVSYGTGTSASLGSMPVAGKTGTTTKNIDRWFVGYTPYYVAATWIGYENDDNVARQLSNGANYSAQIWKKVMSKIHQNLSTKTFSKPQGVAKISYCIDSGKIATDLCAQDPRGSRVKTEWVSPNDVSNATCDVHKVIKVCSVSGLLAGENCPEETVYERVVAGQAKETSDFIGPIDYCDVH